MTISVECAREYKNTLPDCIICIMIFDRTVEEILTNIIQETSLFIYFSNLIYIPREITNDKLNSQQN